MLRLALLLLTCVTCLGSSQMLAGASEVVAIARSGAIARFDATARFDTTARSGAIALPPIAPQAIVLTVTSTVTSTVISQAAEATGSRWRLAQGKTVSQLPTPTSTEAVTARSADRLRWPLWLALTVLGVLSGVGAIRYCIHRFQPDRASQIRLLSGNSSSQTQQPAEAVSPAETVTEPIANSAQIENTNGHRALSETSSEAIDNQEWVDSSTSLMQETTRLPKINIREELIRDLHSLDPMQRRKAIWDLGQRGDSQAIQPLVDLMLDSDSNQRSLILAAISEIGVRTLKPMNRALIISLQDESSDVRKNAIRDLTRVYDQIAQMSQLLGHAINDTDPEVQETAHWALNQLNRIRTIAGTDSTPLLTNSTIAPEYLPGDQSSSP